MLPDERFLVSKDSFDYVKGEINGIAPENIFLPVRGKIEDPNLSKYFIHQATIFESDGTMHLILLCYFGDAIRWAVSAEKKMIACSCRLVICLKTSTDLNLGNQCILKNI